MNAGTLDALHVLAWIGAYTMVGLAVALSFVSTRLGNAGLMAARSFALRESYFVVVISSTYLLLALSPGLESSDIYSALTNGAAVHGLLLLASASPGLFRALPEALGATPPSSVASDRPGAWLRRLAVRSAGALSPRELEVALLLAEGKAYKLIASDLGVSLSTVRTHVERIYDKLGIGNKVELANRLRAGRIG